MNESALRSILSRLGIQVQHRSRSGWLDFTCPLAPYRHANGIDRRPSAGALIAEGGVSSWVCHTCKSHGRISGLISDIQRHSGRIVPGLLREAEDADIFGIFEGDYGDFESRGSEAPPEPLVEEAYEGMFTPPGDSPDCRRYLASRGVSRTTAETLGLLWDARTRRILFPVRDDQGNLYGFTGRAVDPDAQPKIRDYAGLPKRHFILGEQRWKRGLPLFLVEGLFGYAHLVEIGAEEHVNVGALLGSVMTPEKAMRVRLWDSLTILAFDNDTGGEDGLFGTRDKRTDERDENGAIHLLEGYVPVIVPEWPSGKTDPDELTLDEVISMTKAPVWA